MTEQMMTFSGALNAVLHQAMRQDGAVVCIGEDIAQNGGVFGVTHGLCDAFGSDRVIDTPISETAFVGMAVGAAMTGLKPMVELMFCDFTGVCFDQILNQAAKARFLSNGKLKLPLVIRTTMGAGDGSGAMHSQSLHGLFASIPGLIVVCPSSPADAAGLLKSSLASDDPVIFLENKQLYELEGLVDAALPPVPLGSAKLAKDGADVTIVATSAMVHEALAAATRLESAGVSAAVLDPRTVKPLDEASILEHVRGTGRLLVVDEGAPFAGLADAVISSVVRGSFPSLKAAPQKLCPPDTPVPYAPAPEACWLPGSDAIVEAVVLMMED